MTDLKSYELIDVDGESVMRFDAEALLYDDSDEFLMGVIGKKVTLEYTLNEGDIVLDENDTEVPFEEMIPFFDWMKENLKI